MQNTAADLAKSEPEKRQKRWICHVFGPNSSGSFNVQVYVSPALDLDVFPVEELRFDRERPRLALSM